MRLKKFPILAIFLAFLFLTFTTDIHAQEAPASDVPELLEDAPLDEVEDAADEPDEDGGDDGLGDADDPEIATDDGSAEAEADLGGIDASDGLDGAEVIESIGVIKALFDSGYYPVAVGLILLVTVFLLRKFGIEELVKNPKALSWLVLGLAAVSSVGISLAGGVPVPEALYDGFLSAVTAMGGWDLTQLFHPAAEADTSSSVEADVAESS